MREQLETWDHPCGHVEEMWQEFDDDEVLRERYYTDCTPQCWAWGGVK